MVTKQIQTPKTVEISKKTVNWVDDVLPYYQPCAMFMAKHLIYFYTNGNLLWAILLAYVINFPYFKI